MPLRGSARDYSSSSITVTSPSNVMDVDFRENLANGEPMSRGGQLLSETEAELSGDEGALRPVPGLEV